MTTDPAKIPDRMTLHGTAVVSEHMATGHGFYLRTQGVRDLASHAPFHHVADHSGSITAIAGTVRPAGFRDFQVEAKDTKGAIVKLDAAALDFTSELHRMHQGYEAVARHVLAMQKDGRVPNVSVSITASDLSYDERLDRVYFDPPYSLRHLGTVDKGAFSDDVGVGIWSAECNSAAGEPLASIYRNEEHKLAGLAGTAAIRITVENGAELAACFAEKHLADPALLAKVGKLLGTDKAPPKGKSTAATATFTVTLPQEGIAASTNAEIVITQTASTAPDSGLSYTPAGGLPNQGDLSPPVVTSMTQPPATATPAGPAAPADPVAAKLAELDVLRVALASEVAAAKTQRENAEAAELSALKTALKADFGLADEDVAHIASAPMARATRASLEKVKATGNPLPKGKLDLSGGKPDPTLPSAAKAVDAVLEQKYGIRGF